MAETQTPRFKGEKLKALLELYRRFRLKAREDPEVARSKQQEYARKVLAGDYVDFSKVKSIVERLGIKEYAVVGGQASIMYGARRTTVDIDILASRKTIEETLSILGLNPQPITIGGYTVELEGIDVDLLHWNDPDWLEPLLDAAIVENELRVVSRPWLMLLKLLASRDIDIADVQAILRGMDDNEINDARRVIKQYAPSELDDFESFIALDRWN